MRFMKNKLVTVTNFVNVGVKLLSMFLSSIGGMSLFEPKETFSVKCVRAPLTKKLSLIHPFLYEDRIKLVLWDADFP